jgi:UDP-N-acetylmuramate--alanine ligase
MDLKQLHRVFFLGIGGIGMSAIARYFNHLGIEVHGYDRTYTKITNDLEEEGIPIIYKDDVEQLTGDFDLVVWTPAIKNHHPIYKHFEARKTPIKKRSEVLGMITQNTECIAVAGTHGKTTVSSLIAHLLTETGRGCTAFLGGILSNYNSNFIFHPSSELTVVEADEFDRSFLRLNPFISVITSTDADHLDIYSDQNDIQNTFSEFARRTNPNGRLYYKKGIDLELPTHVDTFSYSIEESASYYSTNIFAQNGESVFNFNYEKTRLENFKLAFPGIHNVENATVALAIAMHYNCEEDSLKKALYNFKGIYRRFQFRLKQNNLTYIDDYAHHPEEIKAAILSAKHLFSGQHITVVFQPHLFSRTRDFASEFGQALALANKVILIPIYPAREEPIEGVNSQLILDHIDIKNKKLVNKEELTHKDFFKNKHLQVVMTLGAGDIGETVPTIEENLATLYPNE